MKLRTSFVGGDLSESIERSAPDRLGQSVPCLGPDFLGFFLAESIERSAPDRLGESVPCLSPDFFRVLFFG